jgi:hypothetical protein
MSARFVIVIIHLITHTLALQVAGHKGKASFLKDLDGGMLPAWLQATCREAQTSPVLTLFDLTYVQGRY